MPKWAPGSGLDFGNNIKTFLRPTDPCSVPGWSQVASYSVQTGRLLSREEVVSSRLHQIRAGAGSGPFALSYSHDAQCQASFFT